MNEERGYGDPEEIRAIIREEARKACARWEALPWWRKFFSMLVVRWQLFTDKFRRNNDLDDLLDEEDDLS